METYDGIAYVDSACNKINAMDDRFRLAKTMLPIGRTDNRLAENISEKCRPSNIAQLYNTLESQEWVDAKETLEEITDFEEEDIVQFLCACVMVSSIM